MMVAHLPSSQAVGIHAQDERADHPVVVLTGATSQLGVFLIPRLLDSGYRVIAVSRRARQRIENRENIVWVTPENLLGQGAEENVSMAGAAGLMMISCGPIDLAAKVISRWSRIQRLVVFSTTSVFSKAASGNQREREQIAGILQQENILKVLCRKIVTELVILRPTLIYGCGLDRNISRLAHWIRRFGWLPVAGSATGLRQPVHADDLALLAVNALQFEGELGLDSPACGGSTLSFRHMVERIFESQGRPRRVIGLPPGLLSLGISALGLIGMAGGANREMVMRQNSDLVFDDTALKERLNYNPRPFRPSPEDFQPPV